VLVKNPTVFKIASQVNGAVEINGFKAVRAHFYLNKSIAQVEHHKSSYELVFESSQLIRTTLARGFILEIKHISASTVVEDQKQIRNQMLSN
jgi:hypothetical protein